MSEMKNFVITGCPRSGTLFLATNMNLSKKWRVGHTVGGYDDLKKNTIESIQQRLNKNYYGEVNDYLRHHILQLKISRKALIIRNPVDIWVSMANRKKSKLWNGIILELENSFNEFSQIQKTGIKIFFFDYMVTDLSYLQEIFKFVGIDDVKVTKKMHTMKINENKIIKYFDISEFDFDIRNRIIKTRDIYRRIRDVIQ